MANIPTGKRPPWLTQRKKQIGRKRPNREFYNGTRWRKTSKAYRANNPLCENCLRRDIIKDATGRKGVTDHIDTVNEILDSGEDLGRLYDFNFLQTLCNTCHNRKSGREAHNNKEYEGKDKH